VFPFGLAHVNRASEGNADPTMDKPGLKIKYGTEAANSAQRAT
jgi:hypothetical protein